MGYLISFRVIVVHLRRLWTTCCDIVSKGSGVYSGGGAMDGTEDELEARLNEGILSSKRDEVTGTYGSLGRSGRY